MYSGVLALKYQLKEKFAVYGRGELFSDKQGFMGGVIIDNDLKATGYKLCGATLGVEYMPIENSYIRLEGKNCRWIKRKRLFNGMEVINPLEWKC